MDTNQDVVPRTASTSSKETREELYLSPNASFKETREELYLSPEASFKETREELYLLPKASSKETREELYLSPPTKNSVEENKFIYVTSNYTFQEKDNNRIECGKCGKEYSRILSHLKNNDECSESLDLMNFKLSLDKFKHNNRQKKFQIKLRTQDEEKFKMVNAKKERKKKNRR